MSTDHQVFQTASPTRWQRFKWGSRVLIVGIVLAVVILILALRNVYNPSVPQLKQEGEQYKAILHPDKNLLMHDSRLLSQYRGFRQYINAKKVNDRIHYADRAGASATMPAAIRAAFYVDWDAQAYTSLKNNISRMNMVLPEWFFIDANGDSLYNTIDQRALSIIKASGVRTVPMLSNYFGDKFNGAAVHRILNDPAKRARLINKVAQQLQQYGFQGINVDFEELEEKGDEQLIAFMQELYGKLHPLGMLVTEDVMPMNEDFNLKELSKCTDYIFLMSYDQHNAGSDPGPVSDQRWIEATVNKSIEQGLPQGKLVLCIAGYGYDWPKGAEGRDITYEEALTTADESEDSVSFDNDSYNLSYTYTDDNGTSHEVHFTDAATNFNTMRFAAEEGLAGVAMWRLGSEDTRLWQFYLKDVSSDSAGDYNFASLTNVSSSSGVDYIGEGEVLDVVGSPKQGHITLDVDTDEALINDERYDALPSSFVVKKFGKAEKKVVLSFDDGPDPDYTPRILDILGKEHVPASFFILGSNAENNIPIVKRIYNEGHELGNHSFTHPNMARISESRAVLEMNSTRLLIACITGHSTIMFRPPYNADSEPESMEELLPVALSRKYNYLTIGENIDPNDWEPGVTADTIVNRVIAQSGNGNIILLHDAGGNREATIKALPAIIKYFRSKGYTFTTVADLIGKKRDEVMPAVPKNSGYYLLQMNYYLAEAGYWGGHVFYYLFIICIVLSFFRILVLMVLALRERRRERRHANAILPGMPRVSIIVPAYNEEVNAVLSVKKLLNSTYPSFDIIFVDDGSKDATYKLVSEAFKDDPRVQVLTKSNGGKASALNYGIAHTDAEYLLCIDADTTLLPNAVSEMVKHFADEAVGAVAGNVKVRNEVNMITRWQSIEYVTSQNFDRLAFANINAITVVPGAIGAFRKSAIVAAGGFTSDTFAEDCDLTIRLLRAGYEVENEGKAIAMTEAPETVKQFMKQRFRWSFGVMQTFWKNRDTLFNKEYGSLGWVAMPNILVFQFLIPLITPLADLLMLIGLFVGNTGHILLYYAIFMLIDAMIAVIAFLFEKEKLSKLLWIIPQRLVYRWLMLYVLFKSFRRAIKGELQHWGILTRTGNISPQHAG